MLALFLQGDRFTAEEKRKDFEYYDPITTGDSTLSAVVQSIVAAEVGYHEGRLRLLPPGPVRRPRQPARQHRRRAARRLHRWGVVARWSTGSAACATTAAGCASTPACPTAGDPDLPDHLARHPGAGDAHAIGCRLDVEAGRAAGAGRGARHELRRRRRDGARSSSPSTAHGAADRPGTLGNRPQTGGTRADGSRITPGVPDPMPAEGPEELPRARGGRRPVPRAQRSAVPTDAATPRRPPPCRRPRRRPRRTRARPDAPRSRRTRPSRRPGAPRGLNSKTSRVIRRRPEHLEAVGRGQPDGLGAEPAVAALGADEHPQVAGQRVEVDLVEHHLAHEGPLAASSMARSRRSGWSLRVAYQSRRRSSSGWGRSRLGRRLDAAGQPPHLGVGQDLRHHLDVAVAERAQGDQAPGDRRLRREVGDAAPGH